MHSFVLYSPFYFEFYYILILWAKSEESYLGGGNSLGWLALDFTMELVLGKGKQGEGENEEK